MRLTPDDGLLRVVHCNEVGGAQPRVVRHKLADAVQLQQQQQQAFLYALQC
jgi:hypothetical protein